MSASSRDPKPVGLLPAQAVRSLGGYDVEALRRWADENGQRFVLVDCSGCVDRKSVLQAVGRAFAFPEWYGANLDALYDCLTELPERDARGWLVVLERLPRAPEFGAADRVALLDVFRDAADDFAQQRVDLRVFYA